MLDELTAAGRPWLAIDMPGCAGRVRSWADGCDAAVIGLADPQVPPVMVNPFEPEPGFAVQAHARRLAELIEAVFGLASPAAEIIRAGLLRAYADCGWDAVTGAASPGASAPPSVPAFAQLRHAVLATAGDLGCDVSARAAIRGFVHARLEPMWTGPAGRFLEGGHPADLATLLRGNVVLTGDGLAGDEGASFLAGIVLARVAERLRVQRRCSPRIAIVVAPAVCRPAVAGWFAATAREIRAHGGDVIDTQAAEPADPAGPGRAAAPVPSTAPGTGRPGGSPAQVLLGRRSAACGARCQGDRPCSVYELHAASLLARDDERAWLRLWAVTLVLAFLAGRPLPRVPAGVIPGWRALSPRRRECVLATVLDAAVTARAPALRRYYHPGRLMSVAARVASSMLDGTEAVPFRAGPVWVIPPLRWLHEAERLNALGRAGTGLDDIAPPLDFGLAGLPDWPGIRVRDRLSGLRRHPSSMSSAPNRRLARLALHGEGGRARLDADLATALLGLAPPARLRDAAQQMGAGATEPEPGWLEVVLSWPDRIARPAWDMNLPATATG